MNAGMITWVCKVCTNLYRLMTCDCNCYHVTWLPAEISLVFRILDLGTSGCRFIRQNLSLFLRRRDWPARLTFTWCHALAASTRCQEQASWYLSGHLRGLRTFSMIESELVPWASELVEQSWSSCSNVQKRYGQSPTPSLHMLILSELNPVEGVIWVLD